MDASLADLESWLIAITQHTRVSSEALDRIAANGKKLGGAGGANEASKDWPQQLDDMIEKLGKRIETGVSRAMTWGNGQVQSLRNRGMGGTVESAKLDYAMEQLGRQFAAIFMPLTAAATYAAGKLEMGMRGLSGVGQNRLLGGLVGAGVGARFGGVPGAIFGGVVGSAFMGSPGNTTSAVAGALGGALLGFRAGGPWGAVAGGAAGLWAGTGGPAVYEARRATGSSKTTAALGSLGEGGATRALGWIMPERFGEGSALGGLGRAVAAAGVPRRDVTPFQADMGEAGSGYFRMQAAMIRTTAGANFEDAGPLKPIIDILLEIVKLLAKAAGVEMSFDTPASAERARA